MREQHGPIGLPDLIQAPPHRTLAKFGCAWPNCHADKTNLGWRVKMQGDTLQYCVAIGGSQFRERHLLKHRPMLRDTQGNMPSLPHVLAMAGLRRKTQ